MMKIYINSNITMFTCLECGYNTINKFNYNRHTLSKHKKTLKNNNNESQNMNGESQNMNGESQNMNGESQNMNGESQNMNDILPNQCEKCHKVLSSQKTLKVHIKTCKGPNKDKECQFCKKVLATKQSKNNHELICKEKDKGKTINIINNNNNDNSTTNNTTNNNTQNNNIQNIDNSINITVFNSDPKKTTKFDTHHITPDVLIKIFKQSMNCDKLLCSKLLDVIWENVNNRCITKPNIKTNFSKVSGENGSWLSGLDMDIYPKFIKDGCKTSMRLINKYKIDILKLINEDKVDKAHFFLDEMETIEMDDKKMSKKDMDDSNYFYGNSEEESIRINGNQEIDNDRIDEFKHSYARYKLKASDNAKRLLA